MADGRSITARRARGAAVAAWLALCAADGAPATEDSDMKTAETTRLTSRLAGSWYTADPAALRKELDAARAASGEAPDDAVAALILPHAGYAYSGAVAAHGAAVVAGRTFRRVVVLGPTHRVPMRNAVAVPEATHYATILGEMPIDTAFVRRLRRYPLFRPVAGALPGEHSVEIEFPVLQAALGPFKLVPLVVGQMDDHAVHEAADCLHAEIDTNTLVVASTDFTHYGPRFDYVPFTTDVEARLRKLDLDAFEFVKARDAAGFRRSIERTGATICGRDPVAVLLAMLPEDAAVRLLKYDTSGRITGDWENTVSYVSAAVRCRWTPKPLDRPVEKEPAARKGKGPAMDIPDADRKALLALARGTIQHYFSTRRKAAPRDLGIPVTAGMGQVAGAFVTLHKHGDLRGCIGEILPSRSLHEAVIDHALNAAFRDHRFGPLTELELPVCDIEISALSEPREIGSWKEIVLGRHGIVLNKEGRSSVFLPQVAPEQGWDVATTLTHLAMKAGLDQDAWREGATFQVFEAVVFGEKD
ncbi:MAG: AmmeMemoRadiSam system protein B [Lentisphaerae bacterium]|nr:AmmeMemoRadiSam system protein B [Lentisphaerota bacterium]